MTKQRKTKKQTGYNTAGIDQAETAASLFEHAQTALQHDDFDAALRYLQQASAIDSQNQEYLGAYGSLLAEVGKSEEAVQVLQRGVQLAPDIGYEKYMYLGQLLEGELAIQSLQKGIQILQHEAATQADPEEAGELRAQLASGLCALVELHMANAGDVDEVATECEALLSQARTAEASSPEPLQVLASLRSEQGRPDEALDLLKQSMALWYCPGRESADREGGEEDEGVAKGEEVPDEAASSDSASEMAEDLAAPSFEFRFETAKLLIELDETTQDAVKILEDLLSENDGVPDVWYLLAMCHHAGGDPAASLATIEEGEALLARMQIPQTDPSAPEFARLKERVQARVTTNENAQGT